METVVEVQEGMLIDRGYVSRELITNQARKMSPRTCPEAFRPLRCAPRHIHVRMILQAHAAFTSLTSLWPFWTGNQSSD